MAKREPSHNSNAHHRMRTLPSLRDHPLSASAPIDSRRPVVLPERLLAARRPTRHDHIRDELHRLCHLLPNEQHVPKDPLFALYPVVR